MIDLALSDEHRQLAATVREFAARELAPGVPEADRTATPDPELFAKLATLGLPGICYPQRYGGAGLDWIALGLACEELGYVDASCRTALSVHAGLCATGIYQWGTEEQRQRLLRPMAEGRRQGCFGLTEPDAGSDVQAIRTQAVRAGDAYRLRGQKVWISMGDVAEFLLVFATTDPARGAGGMSAFLVERALAGPGLRTEPMKGKYGLRASDTAMVYLDDALVPAANRIGEEGEGFKVAMSCLDSGRFCVASGAAGTLRACLDMSVSYARVRHVQGQEIGRLQLVQQMIAGMSRDYDIARLLWLRAGWLKNSGQRSSRESALAKWVNTEAARRAADDALQVHGATGFSEECPAARYLRNSRATLIYEGTRELQTVLAAEYALGYRRDRPVRCALPPWPDEAPAPTPEAPAVAAGG
ncbi:MAG TPA: acyl-CoA dehydrogenase family protein [Candidatus Dormibacteraeota bacterium]|nr:acyl-CoA dehydrogenase family protein [Candidatus Dormibacteraeota bacterium]